MRATKTPLQSMRRNSAGSHLTHSRTYLHHPSFNNPMPLRVLLGS